jgi:hypothetical protein
MANFSVLYNVGYTMKNILSEKFKQIEDWKQNPPDVELEAPKKIEGAAIKNKLSVFLYKIVENSDLKNHPPLTINSNELRRQAFDLHYMLTPTGADEKAALRMLGLATKILFEKSVLLGADLKGSGLEGEADQIRITMNPVSQEIVTQIWQALEAPMRISIFYLVTPVFIDSEPLPEEAPIRERGVTRP